MEAEEDVEKREEEIFVADALLEKPGNTTEDVLELFESDAAVENVSEEVGEGAGFVEGELGSGTRPAMAPAASARTAAGTGAVVEAGAGAVAGAEGECS